MRARGRRLAVWFNRPAKRVTVGVLFLLACVGATFTAYLYVQQRNDQQSNTRALCAYRGDLQRRYDSGTAFLEAHPAGALGIPAKTLKITLDNQYSALKSLRSLMC